MSVGVLDPFMASIVPPEPVSSADWMREHLYTSDGRAFDEHAVPWVTAPQGPCWAADNPQFRRIWLQWAARMFKTTFAQGVQLKTAHLDPCTMMFATVDETNCKSVFGRLWKMLGHCVPLRDQLPPSHLQAKTHVKLLRCEVYGAWPRGKSKLADKSIRVGHANEIDKWEHQSTSTEGDPLPRFLKRLDEWADSKAILESTPAERRRSRVETGRLRSTNHQYQVPCPHCGIFAPLVKGDGKEPPGLFWERDAAGRSDPDIALRTTYYVCGHCNRDITDIHKPAMMNAGVWVPEGCTVDHDRAMRARELPPDDTSWLRGEQLRNGEDYGSQISVLYALFAGWGVFASRWVAAARKPQLRKQLVTEDLAETWEVVRREDQWEALGARLMQGDDLPGRGIAPNWAKLITSGVDKQADHYVYAVDAWGTGGICHTLAYGEAETLAELRAVITSKYPLENGSNKLPVALTLIDSGYQPKEVYDFIRMCRRERIAILPCKGSNTPLNVEYRASRQGKDSAAPGEVLVLIDMQMTQDWLEGQMAGDPGGYTIYRAPLIEHQDFLEQLLNEAQVDRIDSTGQQRARWEKVNENDPNDMRDCRRYSNVAMLVATKARGPQRGTRIPRPPRVVDRPGGWFSR